MVKKNNNMSKNIDRKSVADTEILMEERFIEKLNTVIKQNKLAFFKACDFITANSKSPLALAVLI